MERLSYVNERAHRVLHKINGKGPTSRYTLAAFWNAKKTLQVSAQKNRCCQTTRIIHINILTPISVDLHCLKEILVVMGLMPYSALLCKGG